MTQNTFWIWSWLLLFLVGCQAETAVLPSQPTTTPTTALAVALEPTKTDVVSPTPTTLSNPATPTSIPTQPATATPPATAPTTTTPTLLPSPIATPIDTCTRRVPQDDLLTIVTQSYGLSRDYAPSDLVPLADYFPSTVTNGYPTELRAVAVQPLQQLIAAMESVGLRPNIISGYRSYVQQNIAYQKWIEKEPDRAAILSARPGHSEHQLGTVVDFGSPELADIVGDPNIEFHTYFYQTSEGGWLAENAHHYGFTLSYPRTATEITGFFYEPWHFRYVGVELATELQETGFSLTEYQLRTQPEPCIPS